MAESVTFSASVEEYDGYLVIIRFYYPSRGKPLVELFYDFDEAIASLERKQYELVDHAPTSHMWFFVKKAKKRETRSTKALLALMDRKGSKDGKR